MGSAEVDRGDFRGSGALEELAGSDFERGIVSYTGTEAFAFGSRMLALPISALWTLGTSDFRVRFPGWLGANTYEARMHLEGVSMSG